MTKILLSGLFLLYLSVISTLRLTFFYSYTTITDGVSNTVEVTDLTAFFIYSALATVAFLAMAYGIHKHEDTDPLAGDEDACS